MSSLRCFCNFLSLSHSTGSAPGTDSGYTKCACGRTLTRHSSQLTCLCGRPSHSAAALGFELTLDPRDLARRSSGRPPLRSAPPPADGCGGCVRPAIRPAAIWL